MSGQLVLATDCCKFRGCPRPVVGHSIITWREKVCAFHNSIEWGERLTQPEQPGWIRELGAKCLAGTERGGLG